MDKKIYSLIFDFFQVSSIFTLLLVNPLVASQIFLLCLQLFALFIILWAAYEMRRTKYYRIPDINKQNELVTTGIYKYIRNPMYFSELLYTGTLVAGNFTLINSIVWMILLFDLLLKINYEEKLLNKYFEERFRVYRKTSWRLIPFLF